MTDDLEDHGAERQILSAALNGNPEIIRTLRPEAFTHWQHSAIASAVRTALGRGVPTDLPNIARIVHQAAGGGQRADDLNRLMVTIQTRIPPGNPDYYAERITDLLSTREAMTSTETFRRKLLYGIDNDDTAVKTEAIKEMREAVDQIEERFLSVISDEELTVSTASLLAEEVESYDWLVPGLLERMDRLILTGFEGTGKSYLLAQLALCIGAGIHPFTQDPLPDQPYRTLVFDAENSRRQIRRRWQSIVLQVNGIRERNDMGPVDWDECARLVSKPAGFDLTDMHQLAEMHQQIEQVQPDLVVMGPLYKMSRLNIQEEQAAQDLVYTLDAMREKYGFALIMEAHAGHASDGAGARRVRPIGSSLFLRWPEFGYGLAPHPDFPDSEHPAQVLVKSWRGSRDERDWPSALEHGGFLPWEPLDHGYYQRVRTRVW